MEDYGRDSNGYYPGDIDRYYHDDTNYSSGGHSRQHCTPLVWIGGIIMIIGGNCLDYGLWFIGIPAILLGLFIVACS